MHVVILFVFYITHKIYRNKINPTPFSSYPTPFDDVYEFRTYGFIRDAFSKLQSLSYVLCKHFQHVPNKFN